MTNNGCKIMYGTKTNWMVAMKKKLHFVPWS